jgi:hypothetical protein
MLPQYINTLRSDRRVKDQHYEKEALFRNMEEMDRLVTKLSALRGTRYTHYDAI